MRLVRQIFLLSNVVEKTKLGVRFLSALSTVQPLSQLRLNIGGKRMCGANPVPQAPPYAP